MSLLLPSASCVKRKPKSIIIDLCENPPSLEPIVDGVSTSDIPSEFAVCLSADAATNLLKQINALKDFASRCASSAPTAEALKSK
jgi:hypothetical protein